MNAALAFSPRKLVRATASRALRLVPAPVVDRFRNYGTIERKAPGLDRIVPRRARVERVASGFAFSEGPVWMPDGYLLFGDLPNNVIWRWDPDRTLSVVRRRSGYAAADRPPGGAMGSNGMTLDNDGRLIVCEPGNRRVTRTESDGAIVVLADSFGGKRLNSPNDVVCRRSDGSIYFTDPPHGLAREDLDPAKELDFNGIYRIAGGKLTLLSRDMTRPNGIAFSPDERWLFVSNSDPTQKIWMRFQVNADGTLADRTVLLDLTEVDGQAPDGLKVDVDGRLYLTGPGGLWIVLPSGEVLGLIRTRQEPSNAAWGGANWDTLFLTAPNELYRIRLGVRGTR
jgi:gluconolactonase